MHSGPNTSKSVLLILPDNTALCFVVSGESRIVPAAPEAPATRAERFSHFLKSFLPRISRVKPVEATLHSGHRLQILTPVPLH